MRRGERIIKDIRLVMLLSITGLLLSSSAWATPVISLTSDATYHYIDAKSVKCDLIRAGGGCAEDTAFQMEKTLGSGFNYQTVQEYGFPTIYQEGGSGNGYPLSGDGAATVGTVTTVMYDYGVVSWSDAANNLFTGSEYRTVFFENASFVYANLTDRDSDDNGGQHIHVFQTDKLHVYGLCSGHSAPLGDNDYNVLTGLGRGACGFTYGDNSMMTTAIWDVDDSTNANTGRFYLTAGAYGMFYIGKRTTSGLNIWEQEIFLLSGYNNATYDSYQTFLNDTHDALTDETYMMTIAPDGTDEQVDFYSASPWVNDTDADGTVSGSFTTGTVVTNVLLPFVGQLDGQHDDIYFYGSNGPDAECQYTINATGHYNDAGSCDIGQVFADNSSSWTTVLWYENGSAIGASTATTFRVGSTSETPASYANDVINVTSPTHDSDLIDRTYTFNFTSENHASVWTNASVFLDDAWIKDVILENNTHHSFSHNVDTTGYHTLGVFTNNSGEGWSNFTNEYIEFGLVNYGDSIEGGADYLFLCFNYTTEAIAAADLVGATIFDGNHGVNTSCVGGTDACFNSPSLTIHNIANSPVGFNGADQCFDWNVADYNVPIARNETRGDGIIGYYNVNWSFRLRYTHANNTWMEFTAGADDADKIGFYNAMKRGGFSTTGYLTDNNYSMEGSSHTIAYSVNHTRTPPYYYENVTIEFDGTNTTLSSYSDSGFLRSWSGGFVSPEVLINETYAISLYRNVSIQGFERWAYDTFNATSFGLILNNCSDLTSQIAYTFTFRDEINWSIAEGDFGGTFTIADGTSFAVNASNVTTFNVCIYPAWANTTTDLFSEYYDDNDDDYYSFRNYFLDSAIFDNVTRYIDLMFALSSRTTNVQVSVIDEYDNPQEDVIVNFLRFYPGSDVYRSVASSLTDANGQTWVNLDIEDVWYTIILSRGGQVLREYAPMQITTPLELSIPEAEDPNYWTYYGDVAGSCTFTNATGVLRCTVTDVSGLMQEAYLDADQLGALEYADFCYQSSTASAATLICNLGNVTGELFKYVFVADMGATKVLLESGFIEGDIYPEYGMEGLIGTFLTVGTLAGVGVVASPVHGVMFSMVGLIMSYYMGIFAVTWGSLLGLGLCAVMLVWKMRRK